MDANRKIATTVGILYIIGTVAGILSVVVMGGLLDGPDYLKVVATNANRVIGGALLVLLMSVVLALVPVMLFPILEKESQILAVGYLLFRGALETLSGTGIAVGWLLLLAVARQGTGLEGLGTLLLRAQDPILSNVSSIFFSLGALMLYYLLYQAKLIPRWISGWGFVAAVLYLVAGLSTLSGSNLDVLKYVMLPQEMVMAVWLIVKGFNSSPTVSMPAKLVMN